MYKLITESEVFVAVGNETPQVGGTYNCFILNVLNNGIVDFKKHTTGKIRTVIPQCNGIFRILTDSCTIFVLLKECIGNKGFKIVKSSVSPDKLLNIKFHCDLLTQISFINGLPLLKWENYSIKNPISFIPYGQDFCMLLSNDMLYYGIIEH